MSFFAAREFLFLFAALATASAQERASFYGDLYTPNGKASAPYSVELMSSTANLPVERTVSNGDGKFELHSVMAGNYTIVVKTEGGDVIGIQAVSTAMGSMPLRIEIAERAKSKPISGTVAAETLQHHPPKKAVHEMNAAMKASQAGDSAGAQEHLLAAIKIDPEFSEAHTNLGAEYTRARKLELAYAEFDAALKTGPKGAMQYCNLAVVELAMRRTAEAEREVRQSLLVDSRYPQSNLLLGKILALQPDHYDEAIRHLKLAAEAIPSANVLLSQLYARTAQKPMLNSFAPAK